MNALSAWSLCLFLMLSLGEVSRGGVSGSEKKYFQTVLQNGCACVLSYLRYVGPAASHSDL